jgi:hypothetical protein
MRHFAAFAVLLALVPTSITARQSSTISGAALEAHGVLNALYPELRTQSLAVETLRTGQGLQLRVAEPVPERRFQTRDQATRLLLAADLAFDQRNVLTSFRAAGPILRESDNSSLRSRLRAASQPTEALLTELQSFGIRTGAAMRAGAPIADLEQVLGSLSVRSVSLKSVASEVDSRYGAVWEMSVTSQRPSQSPRQYAIQFEPYGGRVVGLKLQ